MATAFHTTDEIEALMREGKSNADIHREITVSPDRLRRIRTRLIEEGVIKKRPRRVGLGSITARVVEEETTEEEQEQTDEQTAVPAEDDGMTLVENGYLRTLEIIAELAHEGIEQRAEIARLKAGEA